MQIGSGALEGPPKLIILHGHEHKVHMLFGVLKYINQKVRKTWRKSSRRPTIWSGHSFDLHRQWWSTSRFRMSIHDLRPLPALAPGASSVWLWYGIGVGGTPSLAAIVLGVTPPNRNNDLCRTTRPRNSRKAECFQSDSFKIFTRRLRPKKAEELQLSWKKSLWPHITSQQDKNHDMQPLYGSAVCFILLHLSVSSGRPDRVTEDSLQTKLLGLRLGRLGIDWCTCANDASLPESFDHRGQHEGWIQGRITSACFDWMLKVWKSGTSNLENPQRIHPPEEEGQKVTRC